MVQSKGLALEKEEVLRDLRESDIIEFSRLRGEPKWVLERRLEAYRYLKSTRPDPQIDPVLEKLAYRAIIEGYLAPTIDFDEAVKYAEKIGMPKEELEMLAGGLSVTSDNRLLRAYLKFMESRGIKFSSMDEAVKKYDIVKDYMFKLVTPTLNRKSAYHVMLWSGGPFLYVPKGVRLPQPIYSIFTLGLEGLSQTEHTLIIADESSLVNWIEGCVTPFKINYGVHLGALEGFALKRSSLKIVSINNWMGNIYHMPIKRLIVYDRASAELSMVGFWAKSIKVAPQIDVVGESGKGIIQNVGFYTKDEEVFSSPKVVLRARSSSAMILNRTVVTERASEIFKGAIVAERGAKGASGFMSCNTLILGDQARSIAIPGLHSEEKDVDLSHEAAVGRVDYEKLFYLELAGFTEEEATWMLISGFFEPILSKMPGTLKEEVRNIVSLALKAH